MEAIDILTDDERRRAEELNHETDDFLARFQKWAALKTDAPAYTVRAAGLQALSLAAGDTVVLPPLFDGNQTHMNLYILIVGPSTTMRKTTVLNMATGLLPRNKQTGERYIEVLDDTSIQALNRKMADAGRMMAPVLINMDEVAGMFQMSRKKDSYLGGFDKVLLKAFDHSPVHISRVKDDIKVPEGAFVNLFAASTPEPLAEVLGSDDVESGLLPRFIVFDARDAIRGKRIPLSQRKANHERWEAERDGLADFLYQIAKDRADGIPTATDLTGKMHFPIVELDFSDEAVDRLDAIEAIFYKEAGQDTTSLGAIKGRAFWHIFKLSGLFALARGGIETKVEVDDVLRAAYLIETTAADLVAMADEVGTNAQERLLNAIMDFLREHQGARAKQSVIARRFKLSARDLTTAASTLIQAREQVIMEHGKDGTYWRAVG